MSASDGQKGRVKEKHSSQIINHTTVPTSSSPPDTITPNVTSSPHGHQLEGHRRLVFSDPVAFRYLEDDPATSVLDRRRRLPGYEIHLVEQWACSRIHPTFVIATYTGDSSHSILVDVLSVPKDESSWSAPLKVYFKAMSEYHAREKETPLGTLMVTNLSGFPSSLTVISVTDGDVRKHREDFIVNENLKRLGCAGRAGLNLQSPQSSTISKFHHLYRTSETIPLYTSVIELVKLCQVSLSLYGKLAPAYADGLLCDITEKSINDWWSDIGIYIYNIEPSDGILGPSTVSALVGLLMGAFNRMKAFGAPVGKDVFDAASTKRAIGYFQKSQRMDRTRRLDRQTLMKLHKVTAKTASGESWTVPKAVKSTVAELSGKGGEMVMGIVGGREKAGISEVETLDIEKLSQLVTGAKARWLWQGKVVRSNDPDMSGPFGQSDNDKIFSSDDHGNYMWTGKHRDSVWTENTRRPDHTEDTENRTGFGRLKDAVGLPGLRSHQARHSKDESRQEIAHGQDTYDLRDEGSPRYSTVQRRLEGQEKEAPAAVRRKAREDTAATVASPLENDTSQASLRSKGALSDQASEDLESDPLLIARDLDPVVQSRAGKLDGVRQELTSDPYKHAFRELQDPDRLPRGLRQTKSLEKILDVQAAHSRISRVPRCLSFSEIESAVVEWDDVDTDCAGKIDKVHDPYRMMIGEKANAVFVREKAERIDHLERVTVPFTEKQVSVVDDLDEFSRKKQDELNTLYYERLEDFQTQKATSADMMANERQGLNEDLRNVEMLGAKLDYELNALNSRVEEVEDGVAEFERAVVHIESRVEELVNDGTRKDPWLSYVIRFFRS
jgi:predicted protein tyrosine phosphatase